MTEIRFIIGTGRSGTRTMFRMFTGADEVEIHHEYNVLMVQKIGLQYHSGVISRDECSGVEKQKARRSMVIVIAIACFSIDWEPVSFRNHFCGYFKSAEPYLGGKSRYRQENPSKAAYGH